MCLKKTGDQKARDTGRNIPPVQKANGKTGRGDLLIKDANVGGARHLVIDIACTHEFCGNNCKDVTRNGQLREPDVNKLRTLRAPRWSVTRSSVCKRRLLIWISAHTGSEMKAQHPRNPPHLSPKRVFISDPVFAKIHMSKR